MGINGLTIGTESGDDGTLALAGKGYTAADILEQCRKLDEAGIEYYFVYMTGLAGKATGQRVLECGEQRRAVQPAQPLFYLGGFSDAVPGYGAVPHGAGGAVHTCRGEGAPGGTTGIHQKSADTDAPVCRLQFKFLPGHRLSAEGAGFGGQRTAAHHKYGKGGGNGTVPQEPEIFMIILQKLTAAPCDAEKLQAVVML